MVDQSEKNIKKIVQKLSEFQGKHPDFYAKLASDRLKRDKEMLGEWRDSDEEDFAPPPNRKRTLVESSVETSNEISAKKPKLE